MKKIYILALVAFGFAFTATAQFTEDFEDYLDGEPIFNSLITTWSGMNSGTENMLGSTSFSSNGAVSGFIGGDGAQDAVLDFPGDVLTSGTWTLTFKMFIPAGSSAYFNLQGDVNPNANANLQFTSNNLNLINGELRITPGVDPLGDIAAGSNTVPYPSDEWFTVSSTVDLTLDTYEIFVNGDGSGALTVGADNNFGGADFFSNASINEYYIDEIDFREGSLGANDFNADVFSVYPNPVVDVLNIDSQTDVDAVVVYDILGKVVAHSSSKSVDMSSLTSGIYLVNITIGDTSKTVKVIK